MSHSRFLFLLVLTSMMTSLAPTASSVRAAERQWTDETGRFQMDAELIAFSASTVVLKRKDGELVAVPIERLSDADREFLKSREAHDHVEKDVHQTWTMRGGLQVVGRVVAYGRKEVTLQRRRNRIFVNDRRFDNLPEIYQQMIPQIVGHFEGLDLKSREDLQQWILRQRGEPRTFVCDGVILELESGDEYAVPFFFFSEQDRTFLRPGWEQWLASAEKQEKQAEHDLYLQAQAQEYQRDRAFDRRVRLMQLELLAVNAGVVDLWEVALIPQGGFGWPMRSVVVPARNSLQATEMALQQFPGHLAGPVRRVNR
jgi:hypothetical protein